MVERIGGWLDRIDPGVHRRVKGLRLVTAYGIAAMLGALLYSSHISAARSSVTWPPASASGRAFQKVRQLAGCLRAIL